MSERSAEAGELCTCGRPAAVVFVTDRFGEIGACLIEDAGRGRPWPCIFCDGREHHRRGERCPAYRLRLEDPCGTV